MPGRAARAAVHDAGLGPCTCIRDHFFPAGTCHKIPVARGFAAWRTLGGRCAPLGYASTHALPDPVEASAGSSGARLPCPHRSKWQPRRVLRVRCRDYRCCCRHRVRGRRPGSGPAEPRPLAAAAQHAAWSEWRHPEECDTAVAVWCLEDNFPRRRTQEGVALLVKGLLQIGRGAGRCSLALRCQRGVSSALCPRGVDEALGFAKDTQLFQCGRGSDRTLPRRVPARAHDSRASSHCADLGSYAESQVVGGTEDPEALGTTGEDARDCHGQRQEAGGLCTASSGPGGTSGGFPALAAPCRKSTYSRWSGSQRGPVLPGPPGFRCRRAGSGARRGMGTTLGLPRCGVAAVSPAYRPAGACSATGVLAHHSGHRAQLCRRRHRSRGRCRRNRCLGGFHALDGTLPVLGTCCEALHKAPLGRCMACMGVRRRAAGRSGGTRCP
mmetsp:Transcript_3768/g.10422  ORF Transcript_3768/g.10422 Transcript_3768/m.10422 type:complete len:440 (+) Transcript_3768:101-1420(+)